MQSEQRHPRRGTAPCRGWVEARGASDLGKSPYRICSPFKKHVIKANKLLRRSKTLTCFVLHFLQMVVFSTHCSHVWQEHGAAETSSWTWLWQAGKGVLAPQTQNKPAYPAQDNSTQRRSSCLKALHQGEDGLHLLFPSLEIQITTQVGRQVSISGAIWHASCFICLSCRTQWQVACGITQPSKAFPPLQIN